MSVSWSLREILCMCMLFPQVCIDFVFFFFIQKGADLNKTDDFGLTPLLWACANGQLITVKYLLEMNVDPSIVGNHGENALLFSSCYGYSEIVKLLLQLGMDVNYVDEVRLCSY